MGLSKGSDGRGGGCGAWDVVGTFGEVGSFGSGETGKGHVVALDGEDDGREGLARDGVGVGVAVSINEKSIRAHYI